MYRSETLGKLAAALSALQGELSHVAKNSHGYGYDYADLAAVLDVARPLLVKNGLSVTQLPAEAAEGTVALESVLLHSSGEWISSVYTMGVEKGKNLSAAQAVGSVITYARRYAMAAMLGIAQTDDDAAQPKPPAAQQQKSQQRPSAERRTQISEADSNLATEAQLKKLWAAARGYFGDSAEAELRAMMLRRGLGESTKELTRDRCSDLIGQIEALAATGEKL